MRTHLFIILVAVACFSMHAQAPTQLTTDLLEHTDRVFLDGYPSTVTPSQLPTLIERYQMPHIRSAQPSLGWVVNSSQPNTLQTAYHIVVASTPEALNSQTPDMWNSQRVESSRSTGIVYEGKSLAPSTVYYWKVKTWDNHGVESPFSQPKAFMTAPTLDNGISVYPLQITNETAVSVVRQPSGTLFADFGKAAFGQLQLTLSSASGNDTVIVHMGEAAEYDTYPMTTSSQDKNGNDTDIQKGSIQSNGRIDRTPEGTVRYSRYSLPLMAGTHTYMVKIAPDKRNTDRSANVSGVSPIYMPDYTGEVYPFRYCEIEGYTPPIKAQSLVRTTVHYPFNDNAATFHSSDKILNQVWEMCKYSIKATSFCGTYVDGDRERIPYEADALINQLCHYSVDREFSMARHSVEYLIHKPTWPTEWNLQTVLMAWNDYLYTGDIRLIEQNYESLKAKTLLALKESNGLISTRTGKQSQEFLKSIHYKGESLNDIVDWPRGEFTYKGKKATGEADGYELTTYNTVVNAFHYEALRVVSHIAKALNKPADHAFYSAEADRLKRQFNRLLIDPKTGYYKDGVETSHHSLHANMMPFAFGMVPEKNRKAVTHFIKSRGMACSVYGSQFLLDGVYNANDAEHGLSLLASTDERSWYNMIRVGSTVSLEAWDTRFKPNQDWNHAWGAAPSNLIPRKLMGIEPLEPGFARIAIKPQPATLRQASVTIPTMRGTVSASFTNDPGKEFDLEVTLPANTTADVWMPLLDKKQQLLLDGALQKGETDGQFVKLTVGSGKHRLKVTKR